MACVLSTIQSTMSCQDQRPHPVQLRARSSEEARPVEHGCELALYVQTVDDSKQLIEVTIRIYSVRSFCSRGSQPFCHSNRQLDIDRSTRLRPL
jgi:hypothetical protein